MTDHAVPAQLAEQFKSLFTQLQKLAQEANPQDVLAQMSSDPRFTHLQRHIFQELMHDQSAQFSISRDDLTGLLVRSSLVERLDQALEGLRDQTSVLAVCFVDLDGFKAINDQYGHAIGDQVLSLISSRLQDSIRSGDLLCRWGGDEFVVVLQNVDRHQSVEGLANRLLGAISNPLRLSLDEPLTLFLGASIGVSVAPKLPLNASQPKIDALALIEKADQAMYSAKRAGKNRVAFAA
jgi:diguanylate cyclase (GGDEF)-like protein